MRRAFWDGFFGWALIFGFLDCFCESPVAAASFLLFLDPSMAASVAQCESRVSDLFKLHDEWPLPALGFQKFWALNALIAIKTCR